MKHLQKLMHAARFAAEKHSGQNRKGSRSEPYINHPLEVAHLVASIGQVEDADILMAALLHDTLEDTDTTQDDLTELFGERVCKIVLELSDNKDLPKQVRKQLQIEHAPHISHEAKTVKLADKISNIRDVVENPAMGWSIERRIEYVEWGVAVAEGLRGANAYLEEHFDRLIERSRSHLAVEKDLGGSDG